MVTKNSDKKREQLQTFSMEDIVPKDHLLRAIEKAVFGNSKMQLEGVQTNT